MLSRCPWGRNECVTNELQRASAGRLMYGMLPKSIDRKRCIIWKQYWGIWGLKETSYNVGKKCWNFGTFLPTGYPCCQFSSTATAPFTQCFPPPPPQHQKKKGLAGLQHYFFGGKGKGLYNQECFKELFFFFKLDLQHALIFSWHFVQDCSLFEACQVASLSPSRQKNVKLPKCWYKFSTT